MVVFCLFQSNVIEASPDMKRESEKEWYFGNADKERRGPFSFEEVCGLLKFGGTFLVDFWFLKCFVWFCIQLFSVFENYTQDGLMVQRWLFSAFCSPDAGVLEHWCPNSKDSLLGPRDGWLAPPAGYTPTKMVSLGYWTGSDEWIWSGHINSEHAHHHVLLLPKQVGWSLRNTPDFFWPILQFNVYDINVWIHKSLSVLNQCFLCFLLRDQDNAIIRPLPKIKRMISDNACLPHIVQVKVQVIELLFCFFCLFFHFFFELYFNNIWFVFFTAAFDLWPDFGGKGSKFAVLGDAGQP